MNRQDIKEKYDRFKQWQQQPVEFKMKGNIEHECPCCGHRYVGNFCPCCSQKLGSERINWNSVRQGVMDIWGLGTRSLLNSLLQLLCRPGHFISDYLDGKRQVSFPPVKMLFIVAVIYSMFFYWLFPDVLGIDFVPVIDIGNEETQQMTQDEMNLMKKYYSWFLLIIAVLAVIPTWIMFRYSPRHTAHTLPEGFFIQVFLANLTLAVNFVLFPIGFISPLWYTIVGVVIIGIYYLIVYQYLFGYGFWGTLWRSGFVFISALLLSSIISIWMVIMNSELSKDMTEAQKVMVAIGFSGGVLLLTSIILAVGFVINYIATKEFRKELKQRVI